MDRDKWVSLGRKIATEDDGLEYRGVPKNALFRWIDHTKDISKRIFIIENNKKWVSLGRKIATEDDGLEYRGVPKNALFRWIDHTKDISKRIFIIENNKETWY